MNQYIPFRLIETNTDKPVPKRSCNRHFDCDYAEEKYFESHPEKLKFGRYIVNFHCYNDECEECFGY